MLTSRRGVLGGSLAAVVAVVITASTLVVMNGRAGAAPTSVRGNFASHMVTGTDCLSAVELCTAGSLSGGLRGEFELTGSSLLPSVDTPTTGVVLYTGDLSIHTKDGDLTCKDAGAFRTISEGSVSSVCTIVGGTAALAGATGIIQFTGTLTATGGSGDYRGTLIIP